METYQQIRIKVNVRDVSGVITNPSPIRFNARTKKDYKYVKGIYVSMPDESLHKNAFLSLKIGQIDLFDENHETKLLACGFNVAPNDMSFRIGYNIEAAGSEVEGKLSLPETISYEFDVIIYLWLSNAAD